MNTFHSALAGVLSLSLSAATHAAPVPFTDYAEFYRSLGRNLFRMPGRRWRCPAPNRRDTASG
jgi:hypothetical protein